MTRKEEIKKAYTSTEFRFLLVFTLIGLVLAFGVNLSVANLMSIFGLSMVDKVYYFIKGLN